jgi:hypothetical protein
MEKEWMGSLSKKKLAVHFVRETLGCACPSEVFDHYQVQLLESGHKPFVQMIMGDRLLVRIANVSSLHSLEEEIWDMLSEGLEERERRGLNRFRLVMVETPQSRVKGNFTELAEKAGPRVHLHVISNELLKM